MPLSTTASAPAAGLPGLLSNLPEHACPFLDILPIDIRLMIYRYLLVGRYNKQQLHMKSAEVRSKMILVSHANTCAV